MTLATTSPTQRFLIWGIPSLFLIISGRGRQGPQANMLTNCTLGGLPLLLLGNKLNRLLQGPVRLSVPEEIGHDFLVSHSTYQVVFNDLITEVICVRTAHFLTFRGILA